MSKLKNKIKKDLHEVTANELGAELEDAKGEVKRVLPSVEDDEAEKMVADIVTGGETNQNDSSTYTQKVSEEEGDLSDFPRHITPETGDSSVSRGIGAGMNPETGDVNHEELMALVNDINSGYGNETPQGPDGENEMPFESVNPRMSKDELMESILNQNKPKVIKRVKVKDIKNGK